MKRTIVHMINLSGIGGVQQRFPAYYNLTRTQSRFIHRVFGSSTIDRCYTDVDSYQNIARSVPALLAYGAYLISPRAIVHLYNKLPGKWVAKYLSMVPTTNIVFGEYGSIWNAKEQDIEYIRQNAQKSKLIIANSEATKIMLMQRAGVPEQKIKVVYNGILNSAPLPQKKAGEQVIIGYIGRLVEFKGVQTLIESVKKIGAKKKIVLKIAGTGYCEEQLKRQSAGCDGIQFVGRVSNPLEFINSLDILVVPSIREPLGNVIIEAGFCKKAVIASRIDGIPELITHGVSGYLLEPRHENVFENEALEPEYVVSYPERVLVKPKALDADELARALCLLVSEESLRERYGNALYKEVMQRCTVKSYFERLEDVYQDIFGRY